MKLYLAHPLDARKEVRERELEVEKAVGIELYNPFYDSERSDIVDIDAGRTTRWQVPAEPIVNRDVKIIQDSDGLVAVLADGLSYGTIMEIVYAYLFKKPVYLIDLKGHSEHPWLRYHTTRAFTSWEEFEKFLALNKYYRGF